MRFLLVEDDPMIGDTLRAALRMEGHAVDWVRDAAAAQSTLASERFDLLLLDLGLPQGSGLDVLRAARARGDSTPVIVLTARDGPGDRVAGLDAGADDYLVKPFAPEELAARLRAVQRRQRPATTFVVGEATLDLEAHAASTPSGRVELTAREWTLVEALAQRAGRVVAKSDLEQLVLGAADPPSSNALEVHVSSLRRKLGRDVVETVRGLGYRLGEISR